MGRTDTGNQQQRSIGRRLLLGAPVLFGGLIALAAPLLASPTTAVVLGLILIGAGAIQLYNLVTANKIPGRSAFVAPGAFVLAGLMLMEAPEFSFAALAGLIGLSVIVDGISKIIAGLRGREKAPWSAVDGGFRLLLGIAVAFQWPIGGSWSLGIVVGFWLLSTGWILLSGREAVPAESELSERADRHPNPHLGLPPHPVFARLRTLFIAQEEPRQQTSRYWRWVFVITFFIIHSSRMQVGGTVTGWWGPTLATIGDVLVALLLAYLVVAPLRLLWRGITGPAERHAWRRFLRRLDTDAQARPLLSERWAVRRMRADLYDIRGRRSPSALIGWGLTYGLPLAAVLVAITPLLGFSWFFNTESWTAALNEAWATERTVPWRVAMVKALRREFPGDTDAELFRVQPKGVGGSGDFSFLVVGDPGEGDPSQYVPRSDSARRGAA